MYLLALHTCLTRSVVYESDRTAGFVSLGQFRLKGIALVVHSELVPQIYYCLTNNLLHWLWLLV